ncbi:MAG: Dickkopf N-terminal cysteine-rich domain-containing protein [Enhygromyxa sp.]
MRFFGLSTLALVAALGCDASLGSVAASETGSAGSSDDQAESEAEGDGDGDAELPDPFACIGGQLCPEGRSCQNGLCLVECSDDDSCKSDEYCGLDGLCHPKTIPSCSSDQDCATTQTCVNQVCSAVANDDCDPFNNLQDGCASNAVCLDWYDDQPTCYQMPACAADGSCPIGVEGAICNTDYLPNKDAICLIGMCSTPTNCPDSWSCVRYDNEVLGYCSNGALGSPCTGGEHCISGTCVPVPGLNGGFCG